MYAPTSVKRPHWIMLGFERSLRKPGISSHTLLGKPLVSYTEQGGGDLHVLDRACPHRAASLARGTVKDACIVCPYHDMHISVHSHPVRFYEYASLQGMVWLDLARELITQHCMPPYFADLSSSFQTYDSTLDLPVNPVVMMEHLLDPAHVQHQVELLARSPRAATMRVDQVGPHGKATYTYELPGGTLVVESEYDVPFTSTLRFRLNGHLVLALVFSIAPVSASAVRVHVRKALPAAKTPAAEAAFRLLNESPVVRGVDTLASVDPALWTRNLLAPTDGLMAGYRTALEKLYPELVQYCTGL